MNRYYSWYQDPGALELVEHQVEWELMNWYRNFGKPVIMTEYGADAIAGFHQDPPVMFTEEYQEELLTRYHNVFDRLNFVIGEHVWAFADFATKQGITRINGNKKACSPASASPKPPPVCCAAAGGDGGISGEAVGLISAARHS